MGEDTKCENQGCKCCSCKAGKWLVMLILLLNTFFLGGIWCAVTKGCATKGKICPVTGKMMGGSMMDASQQQGSATQN